MNKREYKEPAMVTEKSALRVSLLVSSGGPKGTTIIEGGSVPGASNRKDAENMGVSDGPVSLPDWN